MSDIKSKDSIKVKRTYIGKHGNFKGKQKTKPRAKGKKTIVEKQIQKDEVLNKAEVLSENHQSEQMSVQESAEESVQKELQRDTEYLDKYRGLPGEFQGYDPDEEMQKNYGPDPQDKVINPNDLSEYLDKYRRPIIEPDNDEFYEVIENFFNSKNNLSKIKLFFKSINLKIYLIIKNM